MRDKKRIGEMLMFLKEIWLDNPDMRFGQLVRNIAKVDDLSSLSLMEDDEMKMLIIGVYANGFK